MITTTRRSVARSTSSAPVGLVVEDRRGGVRGDGEPGGRAGPASRGEQSVVDNDVSIDRALGEFLAEQQQRLAARTLRTYTDVVGLLRNCLNGYGYQSLDPGERHRWEHAFEDNEDAFVHLFGPEKINENLGEFLGYFMIRKVAAGPECSAPQGP
jgi:hypothetical protein